MATCPTCHETVSDTAKVCPNDGTLLNIKEAKASTGTLLVGTPPPPPSTMARDVAPPAPAVATPAPAVSTPAPAVATPAPSANVTQARGAATAAAAQVQQHTDLDAILSGESQPIVPGTLMGEYEVTVKLGEGGMGEVYAAVQPLIGKKVAIKVLSDAVAANREVVRRFVDEARAVNQIGHANIVDVFSFGQHSDGRHFYVMEHLDGVSLEDEILERDVFPAEETVDIVTQTLDALQAAHDKGIIHRDLKPDNIFLTRDSRGRNIKLLDFGIAKLSGDENRSRTQTGATLGTPDYMSPEQCRGIEIDQRTDIYAMGVILYRMFTGHFPFEGVANVLDLFMKVAHEAPTKPSAHCPVPAAFEAIILRCLEKEKDARYESADELAEELRAALAKPGTLIESAPNERAEQQASALEGETVIPSGQGESDTNAASGLENTTGEQEPVAGPVSTTAIEQEALGSKTATVDAATFESAKRSLLVPIVGASVVALAAGAFFMTRGSSEEPEKSPKTPVVAMSPTQDAAVPAVTPPPATTDAAVERVADAAPEIPAVGGVLIVTGNRKAEVWIDGNSVGKGKSVSAKDLTVGVHEVRVRAPKHEAQTFEIHVGADEIVKTSITLKRQAKAVAGKDPGEKDPPKDPKTPLIKDPDQTLGWDPK